MEKEERERQIRGIRDAIAGKPHNGQPVNDRYSAAGRKPPNPATMCLPCEGMGFHPTNDKTKWPPGAVPDEVGYVFVDCEHCKGTGNRVPQR